MEQQKIAVKKNRPRKRSVAVLDRQKVGRDSVTGEFLNRGDGQPTRREKQISTIFQFDLTSILSKKNKAENNPQVVDVSLLKEVKRVFGSSTKARHWLNYPRHQFAGKTPLEMALTRKGRSAVEEILGQIEHGMFN